MVRMNKKEEEEILREDETMDGIPLKDARKMTKRLGYAW